MCLSNTISVHSYSHSAAHRVILCFGFNKVSHQTSKFTIYKAAEYLFRGILQAFTTLFYRFFNMKNLSIVATVLMIIPIAGILVSRHSNL